jgi:hypothetical protein
VFIPSRLICSSTTCAIEMRASRICGAELAGATVHGRGGYECFPLTLLLFTRSLPSHSCTSLRGIICLHIINMSESSAESAASSPTTSDDERYMEGLALQATPQQSQSDGDGSSQSDQGTSQGTASSSQPPVSRPRDPEEEFCEIKNVLGSSMVNGVVSFTYEWKSDVTVWDDSDDFCYVMHSQEPW